jgi:hypothetical protein
MRHAIVLWLLVGFPGLMKADTPTPKTIKVPFDLLSTRHMVVQVKVNGKGPYPVIFDTGAPVTLLSSKIGREAGLLTGESPKPAVGRVGPVLQTQIDTLQLADLKAADVPAIIMDHPTVAVLSSKVRAVEGIIGFPFFARYRMTLDYQARELSFVPNGYEPADVLKALMAELASRDKPVKKTLAAAALWGFTVAKKGDDSEPGVSVEHVFPESPVDRAGLKAGDRLLTLDDRWTDSVMDCYVAAGYVPPGTEVVVVIRRQGKEIELTVKPLAGL